jgi:hypothetical protein
MIEEPWDILFALGRDDEAMQAFITEQRAEGDSEVPATSAYN